MFKDQNLEIKKKKVNRNMDYVTTKREVKFCKKLFREM